MKRFISALTAFCMCASMTVSSLPASALTLSDDSAINALAGELTWAMDDSIFTPGTDEYATVQVIVSGDPGTYGYEFTPLVNGKGLAEAGFSVFEIAQADGGYGFGSFDYNETTGHVGAAKGTKENATVADGTSILELYLVPPANAAPGTKFELSFDGLIIGNEAEEKFTAVTKNGSITIAGGTETTTQPDTPAPTTEPDTPAPTQPDTPAPTQPNTESLEDKKNSSEWTWYFDDVTYDPAADTDGFGALVTAYVTKDQGTFGFEFTPKIDGKSLADAGFTFIEATQSDGGYSFGSFDYNEEDGHLGGAASKKEDTVLADGTAVVEMYLLPPADAKPGTVYEVSFDGLLIGNYKEEKLYPKSKSGSITIVGSDDPQPTTAPVTDPQPTTAPVTDPPEPTTNEDPGTKTPSLEEKKNASEWTWYFDDVTYNPKNDPDGFGAVVTAYVTKDQGTYGYEFTPLIDGKSLAAAGFTIIEAVQTDGGYSFGSFDYNEEDGHLGGAASKKEDTVLADGTAVVEMYLLPPADAKPGTVYEVSFDGLLVGNYLEEKLYPKTINGSITIVGDDVVETTTEPKTDPVETTTEPVETTTEPKTDPVETTTEPKTDPVETTTEPKTDPVETTTEPKTDPVDTTQPTTKTPEPTQAPSEVDMVWVIDKVEAQPGEKVQVAVSVNGNVGFNSYIAKFTVDDGPVAGDAVGGKLAGLDKVESNPAKLAFGSTDASTGKNVTSDGDVFYLTFTVPSDAAEGSIYNIDFKSLEVVNIDMVPLIPKTEAGWIKIAPNPTTPSEIPDVKSDAQWIIGTTEVDPGATVKLPVSVKGDKDGLNSFIAKIVPDPLLGDGKGEAGTAYPNIKFEANDAKHFYAGTFTEGLNVAPAGGEGDVFYVTYNVPADALPGSIYPVVWSNLEIVNGDMAEVQVETETGWIKIKDIEPTSETPETTTEPVTDTTPEPTPDTTVPDTTLPDTTVPDTTLPDTTTPDTTVPEPTPVDTTEFVEGASEIEAEWIIGETVVKAGAEVDLPITVKGDKDGLNSFIAKLTASPDAEGKNVTAMGSALGDAYSDLKFVDNIDKLAFGGTFVDGLNVAAATDDSVVFTVKFKVPDDAQPGAKYDIKWASLAIESGDMVRLIPTRTNGWIMVEDEPLTTEPNSTEPDSTEPDSTEPDSTEPDSTEPDSTEPDSTEPDSTEPDSTEPDSTEPDSTEPTTDPKDNPQNWPINGRDSKVTWIIEDVEKNVGDADSIKVEVPVFVENDEFGLNSYIANINLDEAGQAVAVVDEAHQGVQYDMKFEANTDQQKYAGTSTTGNQVAVEPTTDENGKVVDGVFTVTFNFTDLSKVEFKEINEDGMLAAVFEVVWNPADGGDGLVLYNAGDETVGEYPINHTVQNGSITLLKEAPKYDKYEYKYELDGKDVFCFAHDPRAFSDVFSSAKILRNGINTTTGEESGWIAMSTKAVTNFTVTAEGGYTSPVDAYLKAGKDVCYDGIALTATFEDEGKKVTLSSAGMTVVDADGNETTDAELVFNAKAYIGVKGDANLDGVCNANDATAVLQYAAAVGNGEQDNKPLCSQSGLILEGTRLNLAMFLADVDGEAETDQTLNANDSTAILRYAAAVGLIPELNADSMADIWASVLNQPYPAITQGIEDARSANAQ